MIGELIAGRYRLTQILGEGGMGTVFAADRVEGGRVAIKTLLPGLCESAELRRRFEREANATSFLAHPNIVNTFEFGHLHDGSMYLVMELVNGKTIAEMIEHRALHPRKALVLARQTLSGLGHAHQHGLVHRDLKPDNIMVAGAGDETDLGQSRDVEVVKLVDFGVVKLLADAEAFFGKEKLTKTGVAFGTPAYMAPEQALGRALDQRADLYSMGVILFEMLTGRPPYESANQMELLRMHISAPVPSLRAAAGDVAWWTPELETLVFTALQKQPGGRYENSRAMVGAIEAAFVSIDHVPNPAAS